mmetsp:Transcript_24814/g.62397  ORF Transcript_24814/g.62397 Transcript_24814/m.62397 type:complete len:218 (-) Transcript_24814:44-697(-)
MRLAAWLAPIRAPSSRRSSDMAPSSRCLDARASEAAVVAASLRSSHSEAASAVTSATRAPSMPLFSCCSTTSSVSDTTSARTPSSACRPASRRSSAADISATAASSLLWTWRALSWLAVASCCAGVWAVSVSSSARLCPASCPTPLSSACGWSVFCSNVSGTPCGGPTRLPRCMDTLACSSCFRRAASAVSWLTLATQRLPLARCEATSPCSAATSR